MNKIINLIDTHNHYNSEQFENDYNQLIKNHALNHEYINIVGTNINDSLRAIAIANQYDNTFATIGIHPENDIKDVKAAVTELEDIYLKNNNKVIAIGECGLDYFYDDNPSKDKQKALLIEQIKLAIKYQLPLVLHIREAHEDCIDILKQYHHSLYSIIIHCFCDDIKYVQEYLKFDNCYISFSGIVTFKKSVALRKCVEIIPLEKLLTETDCPFLSPEPHRGKRNDSNNLIYINILLANLKKVNIELMNKNLVNNSIKALKLYQLKQ